MYGWMAVVIFFASLAGISFVSMTVKDAYDHRLSRAGGKLRDRWVVTMENLRRYLSNQDPVTSKHPKR